MSVTIALAGNPNCGKTTMFNALTGANQYVGNWPGVTVEKKEGKLKNQKDVTVTDLPGIYSLSPYTLEEVVSRDYLLKEKPDVIIDLVDATNIERNLYLATQLLEIGIPVVIALNMVDLLKKNNININVKGLSSALGCPIVETSALKGTGLKEVVDEAIKCANQHRVPSKQMEFPKAVEKAVNEIEGFVPANIAEENKRWYAVKLLERDSKVKEGLNLPASAPWYLPVLGSVFAILFVKQLFGGLGQNFMNPALAARCFLLISFAGKMTDFTYDAVSGATPLAAMKAGESVNVLNLFLGKTAGTIGETSTLAILIGAVILLVFKVIDLRIPLSCLLSFSVFAILFLSLIHI
mgnify:CR=1 FL=1